MRKSLLVLFVVLFVGVGVSFAQTDNLVAACVAAYDPSVDYFPDKTEIEYADNLSIEYFNNYKLVTVSSAWTGATDDFTYALVQCGTPAPDGYAPEQIIEIPATRALALSTTYLPHFVALDMLDRLIGVDSFLYINTPAVQEKVAADSLIEVGSGSSINIEIVLASEADLVMTYGSGAPEYDAHPALIEAGVPVVLSADWTETSPLGRAEWIKFTAAFFNAEADANAEFDAIAGEYESLVALAASVEEQPSVLWSAYTTWGEAWFISGGQSYIGQLLRDAGAIQVLGDAPEVVNEVGSVPFSFEVVYEAGLNADVWFPGVYAVPTLNDLIAQDERYGDLASVQRGAVYNNDARVNENGGVDYFETGVTNPQIILADLIAILHPDLLPDHELYFFRQME
ncbi:MAG: ABC transporter substrate-binding protein [Chloroflexota bacterium]|nr:ABC transporter substrate-binding protein [Chloroflexota bacterium]